MGELAEYYSGDYGDVCEDYPDCDGSCNGACQACIYCGSDQGDKCKCTVTVTHYGYGIVDRDGKPWDPSRRGSQISDTESNARTYVNDLNSQSHVDHAPYRIVRLLYQEMGDK